MPWSVEKRSAYWRVGLLLVAIGGLLAVEWLAKVEYIHRLWPLLLAIMGAGMLEIFRRRGRGEVAYLTVGVALLGCSAVALYCNFNAWGELARLWPVFVAILGVAFVAAFVWAQRQRVLLLAGLLLLSAAAVFYFVFAVDRHLWWTGFVLAGLSIMLTEWAA